MTITGFHDLYVAELQEARSFEAMLVDALARAFHGYTESFCRREFGTRSRASAQVVPVVRPSPKTEGFGPNSLGPKGFPLAGPRGVGRTWPMNHIGLHRPPGGSPRHRRNRTVSV